MVSRGEPAGDYNVLLAKQTEILSAMNAQMLIMQKQMEQMAKADVTKNHVSVPWPQPLEIESGDPFENLESFRHRWENYCTATGMALWSPEKNAIKASVLISAIGNAAMKKYLNFDLTEEDKKNENKIFEKIDKAIISKTNVIYSRYLFNTRCQLEHETFEDYLLSLKKLVRSCNYGKAESELLRDRIVVGIKDRETSKELFRKEDLTLESAINICRTSEKSAIQLSHLQQGDTGDNINKISQRPEYKKNNKPRKCKFCGDIHVFNKNICPAYGKRCEGCGGRNHIKKACRKSSVNEIQEECESDESVIIAKVRVNKTTGHVEAPLFLKIDDVWNEVYCTLDTGAQVCVMGADFYKNITKDNSFSLLSASSSKLRCFNGTAIRQYGVACFECKNKEKSYKIKFHIVDVQHEPLLSEKACVVLGFIKYCDVVKTCEEVRVSSAEAEKIIEKYQDVFEGYGHLPGEISLEVDNTIAPSIQPARRIPVSLRQKLKSELEKLEQDKIIVKETQHTDWVNNILIVSKESKFRICLDPIPLNKALKRPNFQFTTLDEMLPELSKAKVFSTVDAKKGFWQCRLNEQSSKLTTFWTPFGRYRWLRLPFGLCSSPEIFQMQLTSLLRDVKGVEIIADDILIYGVGDTTEEATIDHNIKLENLLKRLREINCKLNKDKVNLLQTSVKFYGHVLTNEGLRVDESKVEAINNMPTPTSGKDVLRFLGMVGYLSKFIDNLSAKATNLRRLTRKEVEFIWSEKEDQEFCNLKKLISSLPTLQYFDVNKEVVIECDASEYGLGAAMYQDNKIISFASRCLTPTEKNYAQIEKEMLAVVFACKRFNQYVAGHCRTVIKTDHRPLINIASKPLIEAPKRLQMMLLTLQKYNVELQFIQGKNNFVADTLSRAPLKNEDITTCQYNLEEKIKERKIYKLIGKVTAVKYLKVSDELIDKIREYTKRDNILTLLISYIHNGFPEYIADLPGNLKEYFAIKHELSIIDGLVFRNDQLLIPQKLRPEMLQKVHVSHNGPASTLRLARQNIFWPGMSLDIKEFIAKCRFCIKHAPSQQKLPLMCHEVPQYPFQYISMDVFSVNDLKYLVTVDHYSDFFELDKLSTLTSSEVILICKKNFARHGIPQRVCTDNATNFVNDNFKRFSTEWNFKHVTSSPHHPESNGKAESAVKIAKRIVLQSMETRQDLWYVLLHHRNVPIQMDSSSPSQKLFSRKTRTGLPCLLQHLKPKVIEDVSENIKERKEKIKHNFDKRSKELPGIIVGQRVAIQLHPETDKKWSFGKITERIDERSYLIQVGNKIYRRDRCHVKPVSEDVCPEPPIQAEPVVNNSPALQSEVDLNLQFPTTELQLTEPEQEREVEIVPEQTSSFEPVRRSGRQRTIPRHLVDYDLYNLSFLKERGCSGMHGQP